MPDKKKKNVSMIISVNVSESECVSAAEIFCLNESCILWLQTALNVSMSVVPREYAINFMFSIPTVEDRGREQSEQRFCSRYKGIRYNNNRTKYVRFYFIFKNVV